MVSLRGLSVIPRADAVKPSFQGTNPPALYSRFDTQGYQKKPSLGGAVGPGVLVAAGVGRAPGAAGVERATAGAARDRVGVVHRETATHQAVDEIDLGAFDVARADRIHEQPDATNFADRVALFRPILEAHAVRHAGAAAWLDKDTQAHLGASLLLQKIAQLAERGVRDADQLGVVRDLGVVFVIDHLLSHVRPLYGLISRSWPVSSCNRAVTETAVSPAGGRRAYGPRAASEPQRSRLERRPASPRPAPGRSRPFAVQPAGRPVAARTRSAAGLDR